MTKLKACNLLTDGNVHWIGYMSRNIQYLDEKVTVRLLFIYQQRVGFSFWNFVNNICWEHRQQLWNFHWPFRLPKKWHEYVHRVMNQYSIHVIEENFWVFYYESFPLTVKLQELAEYFLISHLFILSWKENPPFLYFAVSKDWQSSLFWVA